MPREARKITQEDIIQRKSNRLKWGKRNNTENMIFYLAALFKQLDKEELLNVTGVTQQTLFNYRDILRNTGEAQNLFFKKHEKASNIKTAAAYNKYYDYAAVINGIGLENKSIWERLSIIGRLVFVSSKIKEKKSIEDITELLGVKEVLIKEISDNLDKLTDQDKEEILLYLDAEKNYDKNINIRIIDVEWNSLTQEEKFLHVLLRKHQAMTETEIAQSWDIPESEVTKYLDIVKYISLEEIHELLVKTISWDKIVKKVTSLKELFDPIIDDTKLEETDDEFEDATDQTESLNQTVFNKNTISSWKNKKKKENPLWDENKRLNNMIFYLLMREKGLDIEQIAARVNVSPTTIRNFRDVLRHYPEVQKQFLKKSIELSKAVKYPDEYHYACIVNGLSLGYDTLWRNLSPEAKQVYIWLRKNKTEAEIAKELGVDNRSIARFNKRYWDLLKARTKIVAKTAKQTKILTEKQKQKYLNVEKELRAKQLQLKQNELEAAQKAIEITLSQEEIIAYSKVAPLLIKVEWNSLTQEEKFLHILLRKHQKMSERLIAVSLKIPVSSVTKYFNIIKSIPLTETINVLTKQNFLAEIFSKNFNNQQDTSQITKLDNSDTNQIDLSIFSDKEKETIFNLIREHSKVHLDQELLTQDTSPILDTSNPKASTSMSTNDSFLPFEDSMSPAKRSRTEIEESTIFKRVLTPGQEAKIAELDFVKNSNFLSSSEPLYSVGDDEDVFDKVDDYLCFHNVHKPSQPTLPATLEDTSATVLSLTQ